MGRRGDSANARKAAQDDNDDRLPRRVQLGRVARSRSRSSTRPAIPQISPVEHGGRSDHGRPGRRAGRAGQVLPDAASAPTRASSRRTRSRAPRRSTLMKDGRLHQDLHPERQGGLRRGPRREHRARGQDAGPRDRSATTAIDKNAPTTARWPRRSRAPARTASSSAASPRTTAVQLYKDFSAAHAGREALRAGRRRRVRLHRPKKAASRPTSSSDVPGAPSPTLRPEASTRRRPGVLQGLQGEVRRRNPDPYAIYGYEAMSLALDAIKRAGDKGNDRKAVIDALFETKDRESRARHVRHRRERRHDADRLRRVHDRGRQARVRQGHQGPDGS